jgi:hypothetical protein
VPPALLIELAGTSINQRGGARQNASVVELRVPPSGGRRGSVRRQETPAAATIDL